MGEGDSSKKTRGRAAGSRKPSPASLEAAAPCDLSATDRLERLIVELDEIQTELLAGCSDARGRVLAVAQRNVSLRSELIAKQALPRQMAELAVQLQSDREERARMETGVEFADEGAELPPLGGNECH